MAFSLELWTSYFKSLESSILSDKSSMLLKLFLLGSVKLAFLKAENWISLSLYYLGLYSADLRSNDCKKLMYLGWIDII